MQENEAGERKGFRAQKPKDRTKKEGIRLKAGIALRDVGSGKRALGGDGVGVKGGMGSAKIQMERKVCTGKRRNHCR